MSLGWKIGLAVVLLAIIGGSIEAARRHYEGVLAQVAALQEEKGQLTVALETERGAVRSLETRVDEWKTSYDDLVQRQRDLARIANEAADETRRLNEQLAKHDLGALARGKPGLVERRVNDATARALRLLHCATVEGGCGPGGGPEATGRAAPAAARAADAAAAQIQGGNAR